MQFLHLAFGFTLGFFISFIIQELVSELIIKNNISKISHIIAFKSIGAFISILLSATLVVILKYFLYK